MKRPNRNIEIFSLSVLDLFAAALGAVLIIAITLFPYYLNTRSAVAAAPTDPEVSIYLAQCRADVVSLQSRLAQQVPQASPPPAAEPATPPPAEPAPAPSDTERQLKACREEVASSFIVVVMEWEDEGYDVDLHVTDPAGRTYFYNQKSHAGSAAKLTLDNKWGPGIEVWQHPKASPGAYCIAFHLYGYSEALHPVPAVTVSGHVFLRTGETLLAPLTLRKNGYYAQVATIVLGADGHLDVKPGAWECAVDTETSSRKPIEGLVREGT